MTMVGARVVRKEDPNLITGRGQYTDDVKLVDTAAMVFVRSTEAHAKILSIDTSEAEAADGVLGVYTHADFAHLPDMEGFPGVQRPILAHGTVHFVGDPVAVVLAETAYLAADAAELVFVEYDPLPIVTDPYEAMADDAPIIMEGLPSNVMLDTPWADDIAEVFDNAPRTASGRMWNNRVHPMPLETNQVLADWGRDKLTVWASIQTPHSYRNRLTDFFGISQNQCRVIQPDVGGGFGAKVQPFPELFLVPELSRRHGRPVKYVQTRSECFLLMFPGRDQWHDYEVAFDDEGTILGLRSKVLVDGGGYPDKYAFGMPTLTNWMSSGCYKIPAIAAGHTLVVTNKSPMSAYRGAGRPEASYLIERVIDHVAYEVGLDPADVRMRNFIQPEDFPYKVSHAELWYDSGDYPAGLAKALEIVDYDNLKAERDRRNADPTEKLMGIGLSTWTEIAAFGPRGALEGFGNIASYESAQVKIQPDGTAIIETGASPHGQGTVTTLSQIAADALHMDFDDISVHYGDTDAVPMGIGTQGSRTAAIAGEATKRAATQVFENAKKVAAHLLEANPDDIEVVDGQFGVAGTPSKTVSWKEVGWAGLAPTQLPEDIAPGSLEVQIFHEPTGFTFPSGAYVCVVGIERDTGRVEIERFLAVDDCGTVINPLLAEGQVEGGIVQGIAQAMWEQMTYDENGQPLTATLMDYLVPSAADVPQIDEDRVYTLTPHNSMGAKGIGESGSIGATPAVVNAVVNALRQYGVVNVDPAITPQKVWKIINGNGSEG